MTPHKTCPMCGHILKSEPPTPFREVPYKKTELSQADSDNIAWNYINRQEAQIDHAPVRGIVNGFLVSSAFWVLVIILIQIVSKT